MLKKATGAALTGCGRTISQASPKLDLESNQDVGKQQDAQKGLQQGPRERSPRSVLEYVRRLRDRERRWWTFSASCSVSQLSTLSAHRPVALALILVVGMGLFACGQQIESAKRPKPEHVVSKNYVIGERQTARVGDPIIRVRDYFVHRSQPSMRATDDFVLKADGLVVEGYRDEDYAVRGETTVDGKRFTVVNLPPFKRWPYLFKSDGPAALVSKDGSIYNRLMDGNHVMAQVFKLQPAGVRFVAAEQGEILEESVYANYELVYGGTDGQSINVTFREYRRDKPNEVSHFQNLVLPHDSPAMRFKDTIIEIHRADAQEFIYTVASDASQKR